MAKAVPATQVIKFEQIQREIDALPIETREALIDAARFAGNNLALAPACGCVQTVFRVTTPIEPTPK